MNMIIISVHLHQMEVWGTFKYNEPAPQHILCVFISNRVMHPLNDEQIRSSQIQAQFSVLIAPTTFYLTE